MDPTLASYVAAREICRRHARSFYFASHFLPSRKRHDAYAVYAFCRLIDDAVDEAPPGMQEAGLDEFESLLRDVYMGSGASTGAGASITAAFANTVRRCAIPMEPFLDLARGVRMDLTPRRFADWPELEHYCYHVAGVVGLLMTRVFGLQDRAAERHAIAMGNAMQLTNILRDVEDDWSSRHRIYLPQDELARFGVSDKQIEQGVCDGNWRALMQFQIARARRLYAQASLGLRKLEDDGSRLTAAVMAATYSGILDAIERNHYDVFSSRAHLTTRQKLGRLPVALHMCE